MEKRLKYLFSKTVFPVFVILFSVTYLVRMSNLPTQDKLMVKPVAIILLIIAGVDIFIEFRKMLKNSSNSSYQYTSQFLGKKYGKVISFIACSITYLALLKPVGFLISTPLFVVILSWFLGVRSKIVLFLVPITLTLVLYGLFQKFLSVPLPSGFLSII